MTLMKKKPGNPENAISEELIELFASASDAKNAMKANSHTLDVEHIMDKIIVSGEKRETVF